MTSLLYLIAAVFGILLGAYYVFVLLRIVRSKSPGDLGKLYLFPVGFVFAALVCFLSTYFLFFNNLETAATAFSIFPERIVEQYSENYLFFLKYALVGTATGTVLYVISVFAGELSRICESLRIVRTVFLILISFVMLMGTSVCAILYSYDNIEGLTVSLYVIISGFSLTAVMGIGLFVDIIRREKLLSKPEYVKHLEEIAENKAKKKEIRQKIRNLKKK